MSLVHAPSDPVSFRCGCHLLQSTRRKKVWSRCPDIPVAGTGVARPATRQRLRTHPPMASAVGIGIAGQDRPVPSRDDVRAGEPASAKQRAGAGYPGSSGRGGTGGPLCQTSVSQGTNESFLNEAGRDRTIETVTMTFADQAAATRQDGRVTTAAGPPETADVHQGLQGADPGRVRRPARGQPRAGRPVAVRTAVPLPHRALA